ncbi:hypothetical protein ACGFX4_31640 [Kitasatospora sp. NPDC048365]|uniref:hypothetical protein n=1 Tax=Kitasatospora sp. NPDC048365 TaxID=3364050 RepID=UPI003714EA83
MRKRSLTAAAVNLLLGVPAIVPLFLLWYFASNWPLAAMGWTEREPTENDGVLPWVLFAGPVVTVFALVWSLVNVRLWRRTALAARAYWPGSVVLTLAPTLALIVNGL